MAIGQETSGDPEPVPPPQGMVPANLVIPGNGKFYSPYSLVVDKSTRTLTLWESSASGLKWVAAYATDIGKKEGDKHHLNDHRTPEGVYFFQEMLDGGKINFEEYGERAFTMDYPNFFDQLQRKTGYGIWLHAIPETKTLMRGSRGCVVVRNDVIRKISNYIELKKTPIIVTDKVTFVSQDDVKQSSQKLMSWIENWRGKWQQKQLADYMSFYSDEFKGQGMNKQQWERHKESLNKKYEYIQVQLQEPVVYKQKGEWVVRFLQQYSSDKLNDFGEKFLYLREAADGQWQIVGEHWQPVAAELAATASRTTNTN